MILVPDCGLYVHRIKCKAGTVKVILIRYYIYTSTDTMALRSVVDYNKGCGAGSAQAQGPSQAWISKNLQIEFFNVMSNHL